MVKEEKKIKELLLAGRREPADDSFTEKVLSSLPRRRGILVTVVILLCFWAGAAVCFLLLGGLPFTEWDLQPETASGAAVISSALMAMIMAGTLAYALYQAENI